MSRDIVSSRDSLETVFECLGLEGHCLGLGLEGHCLGLGLGVIVLVLVLEVTVLIPSLLF